MTSSRAPGLSCWTCRLRHQRCNAARPICATCERLEIDCYVSETKPSWMDGGVQQKHMSESIRAKIRKNSLRQKEKKKRLFAHEDQGLIVMTPERTPNVEAVSAWKSLDPGHTGDSSREYLTRSNSFPFTTVSSAPSQVSPSAIESLSSSSRSIGLAKPIELQDQSIMYYVIRVFPFLFPFYQLSSIGPGQCWLFGLLNQTKVLKHLAISLSNYFYSVTDQRDEEGTLENCRFLVRNELNKQMGEALRSIQSTVSALRHRGALNPLLDKIRAIQEIVQLLIVEVTVREEVEWAVHLEMAVRLFKQIFNEHGFGRAGRSLAVLLSALPSSFPITTPHNKPLPNTPDQSAFVFFATLMLFIDIIASTSLRKGPELRDYHSNLLFPQGQEECCIKMETVVGCQNWALVAIGEISALCEWKSNAKKHSDFSVVMLVDRGKSIEQALEAGITSLKIEVARARPENISTWQPASCYSCHDKTTEHASIADMTRIWAEAAKIYLSVTLSGSQVNSTGTQDSVAVILALLQNIECSAQLRTLSWPMCVAGCLALQSQEDSFRRIVETMAHLVEFGTVSNALSIMEAAWDSRNNTDLNAWDIAASLCIFNKFSLLL